MEIGAVIGEITQLEAGGIIIGVFEGQTDLEGDAARVDNALGGVIQRLTGDGQIKGKLSQVTVIHTLGRMPPARVAVVGLGLKDDLTADRIRTVTAEACRALLKSGATTIGSTTLGVGHAPVESLTSAQSIVEGALLGLYTFRKHLTTPANNEIKRITVVDNDGDRLLALEEGVRRGRAVGDAVNQARDLVNEPANLMTPTDLAAVAKKVADENGIEIAVMERQQIEELGMEAFLGVAQGSRQPPKLIVLRYRGSISAEPDIALVGKGITFDSGGISIKPAEGMGEMKGDMAGGASVICAIGAIARLKPQINVMAIVAATENLPGGTALKPGDVLKAMTGKTIEIISTDAEGRLTLADAIGYARKQNARAIIDIATLTGGIRVALGDVCTGAFTNNQDFLEKVMAAGVEAGERQWQMPMFEEYKEQNKSDVADIKNSGGRNASSITAAQFLAEFAGDTPWVHLDIAATSMTEKERGYLVKGATGLPVRTLINLVMGLARP
jgi:leucyl aminopeptidase